MFVQATWPPLHSSVQKLPWRWLREPPRRNRFINQYSGSRRKRVLPSLLGRAGCGWRNCWNCLRCSELQSKYLKICRLNDVCLKNMIWLTVLTTCREYCCEFCDMYYYQLCLNFSLNNGFTVLKLLINCMALSNQILRYILYIWHCNLNLYSCWLSDELKICNLLSSG